MVFGLVVLAAAVRLVGLGWDRPFSFHPDEHLVTDPARRLLASGRLHERPVRDKPTHVYVYPPLLSEILALECLAAYPLSSWPNLQAISPDFVRLAGRATSLASALLTVGLLAMMARRLSASTAAGALVAAVLALSPLHAESSRYATTDVLAGLWVLLAAWAGVRIVEEGRWRHYLLGSVAVGVAVATKYPAAVSCIVIGAAHFARPRVIRAWREHIKILCAALAAFLAMVVALPPGLVRWDEVIEGARRTSFVYGRSWPGFDSPYPALDGLRTITAAGLGWGATAAVLFWLRGPVSRRRLVPLGTLVVGYLWLLGAQKVYIARNLLHFLPATLLLASWGVARLLALAARPGRFRRWRWPLTAAVCATLVVQPVALAVVQVRALAARDTRLLARDWIAGRLKRGSPVVTVNGSGFQLVPLAGLRLREKRAVRPNLDALFKLGYRWVVYSDASDVRYLRSPDRYPKEARAARAWMADLSIRAKLVKHFPRRPLPGWDLPGSTANMYHQPDVRIYHLDPRPGQEQAPRRTLEQERTTQGSSGI